MKCLKKDVNGKKATVRGFDKAVLCECLNS